MALYVQKHMSHSLIEMNDRLQNYERLLSLIISDDDVMQMMTMITFVRVQDLRCGTNVTFRFLAYLVNSGRPAWSKDQTRGKLPMATAQATCVSAGE